MTDDTASPKHDSRRISANELLVAETWFWEEAQKKQGKKGSVQRVRMWCIFILLRYGGLRVTEIMQLRQDSLDFANAQLLIRSGTYRDVPLPPVVSRRLKKVWLTADFSALETPLRCDTSLIRKVFQTCGEVCGLPKGLLTARMLRWNRGIELLRDGIPAHVVNFFLGRFSEQKQESLLSFDKDEAYQMLREHIQNRQIVKTSARNVFKGRIVSLEQHGLLVCVALHTAGGLTLRAIITDTSYKSLQLAVGVFVNASIKAPWVVVLPASLGVFPTENAYAGCIELVRKDDMVTEILVVLSEGSQVCALCTNDSSQPEWCVGQDVVIYFKAFSVILSLE